MIEVELPDGAVVEFPDGTDEDTMKTALANFQPSKPAAPPPPAPEPDWGEGRMAGINAMGNELLASGADYLATPGKHLASMVGLDPSKVSIDLAGIPLTDFAKDQRAESKYKRGVQQSNTPEGLAGFGTGLIDSGINMLPSVITTLVTKKGDLGLGVMGLQVFSTEMTASLNEGKSEQDALKDAAIATVLEIGPEKAFGFFDDLPVAKGVKAWLRQIVAESISESATETGSILDERYRQGKDIGTFWDTLLRTGKAGAAGAVMGGGFGAGALIGKNQAPAAPPTDPVQAMVEAADAAWQERIANEQPDVPPIEPQPIVDPVQAAKDRIAERMAAEANTPEVVTPEMINKVAPQPEILTEPAPQLAPNQVEQEPTPVQERTEATPEQQWGEAGQERQAVQVQGETETKEVPFHQWEEAPMPKRPPTLLEALSNNDVRLDRTKFSGDLVENESNIQVGTNWLFEGKKLSSDGKGMNPEGLLHFLVDNKYLAGDVSDYTDNDAVDLLNRALRGEEIRSLEDDVAWAEYDDTARYNDELAQAKLDAQAEEADNQSAREAFDLGTGSENISDEDWEQFLEQKATEWEATLQESENVDQGTIQKTSESRTLIPEATAQEQTRAAEQAKTETRNGLGQDEVLPEQGEGELFAGNEPGVRPEQGDILTPKQQRVQDAKDRIKSKAGRLNTGVDPEMYKDLLIVGADVVERGAKTLAEFTQAMVKEVGEWVKDIEKHAERIWNDINQQEKQARTPPAQPAAPQQAKRPARPSGETSTKNAARDAERQARGADPIYSEYFKSNPDVVADAEQAMANNSNLAEETVEDLRTNQYPSISRLTEAILVIYKTDVRRKMREQADRMLDENASKEARVIATANYEYWLERNHEIDLATSASGAVWGGIGQFRQRWMAEDYSFVNQVSETAKVIGNPPSEAQRAVIQKMTDQIAELEKKVTEANQRTQDMIDKFHAQGTIDAINKQVNRQGKVPRSKRLDAAIEKELAAIRGAAFGQFGAGIPAAQLGHMVKLGGLLIAKGANTFAKWTVAIKDALGAKIFGHIEGSLKELWEMSLDEHLRIENEFNEDTVESLSIEAEAFVEAGEPITHAVVYKLARAFVLQGMKTESEVMAAVHGVLEEAGYDLSEREVRKIFSQYGQATFPSQAQDKKTLRELRVLVRLQESINKLKEGLDPERTGPQRDKATQEIRDKQRVLNALMRKRAMENPEPSREKLASLDEQRITRLQNQIADLQKQIDTGQKPVKGEPVPDSDQVKRLKAKRDALKKRIKEIEDAKKAVPTEEEKYNAMREKQLRRQLAEVARRVREKDYLPRQRKTPPSLSKVNMDLTEELVIAKKKLQEQQMEWKREQFNWAEKGWDYTKQIANAIRAVKTSFDLSAVLRQGGFYVLSHPLVAIKSFVPMIQAMKNPKYARIINDEILSRPNAALYKKAGLFLAEQDSAHPTKMEEVYMGRWAEKVPGVAASGRAYVTFLNRLRADVFDAALEKFGRNGTDLAPNELKDLATFINNATGRADIKKFNSEGMSSVFFAPRWVASRFNIAFVYPTKLLFHRAVPESRQLDIKLRKHIAGEYARFALGYGILWGLAVLAFGGDDEDETINFDPLSSEFGKVRVGNTRLDMTAGLSNAIVFTTRMALSHYTNSKGEVKPLTFNSEGDNIGFGQQTYWKVFMQFFRSKLAPIPGAYFNIKEGKNVVGETTREQGRFMREVLNMPEWLSDNPYLQEALGFGIPLSISDYWDAMEEHGVPKATALQVLATLGVSMNTYDTESKKETGLPKRESRPERMQRPKPPKR